MKFLIFVYRIAKLVSFIRARSSPVKRSPWLDNHFLLGKTGRLNSHFLRGKRGQLNKEKKRRIKCQYCCTANKQETFSVQFLTQPFEGPWFLVRIPAWPVYCKFDSSDRRHFFRPTAFRYIDCTKQVLLRVKNVFCCSSRQAPEQKIYFCTSNFFRPKNLLLFGKLFSAFGTLCLPA